MTETQFLRFPNEALWREAAKNIGVLTLIEDEEGNQQEQWVFYTTNWAIDVIGTIYEPGEYDDEGNTIVEPRPVDGYHVNVKWLDKDGLPVPMSINRIAKPATPHRIFLGDK